jgi:SAM-dependent methyltransferase
LRSRLPWRAKIVAKLVLARVPVSYELLRRVSLRRHGAMDDPAYALAVFRRHFARFRTDGRDSPFTALELGPGDTVSSAVVSWAHGAQVTHLVDVGRFARQDLGPYRALAEALDAEGLASPDLEGIDTLEELLARCRATYATSGLESLRELPDASIDFCWSQAVLEHVRRHELLPVLRELRRVLRSGGVSSHTIDLRDHLADALNHLRFSRRVWESDRMAGAGFYTNRVRFSEFLRLFEEAGFAVETTDVVEWERLPTPRRKLASDFASLPEEELRIAGFDAILRPS